MYAKSAVISGNRGSKGNPNERRIKYSIQRKIYMPSLKQQHFYYGAILSAIIEYNPDTSLVLLQPSEESRNKYRIQTNTVKQECIIFFKHAFEKEVGSRSWVYNFSDKDKEFLKECHKEKIPVFIYLLCAMKNLKDSEIAVLRYWDEFSQVINKKNFTISLKKRYSNFYLHRSKLSADDILIPRNRIEKNFDDLINETIKQSNGYYCPKCGRCMIHGH